jgi:hypothetical protein
MAAIKKTIKGPEAPVPPATQPAGIKRPDDPSMLPVTGTGKPPKSPQ